MIGPFTLGVLDIPLEFLSESLMQHRFDQLMMLTGSLKTAVEMLNQGRFDALVGIAPGDQVIAHCMAHDPVTTGPCFARWEVRNVEGELIRPAQGREDAGEYFFSVGKQDEAANEAHHLMRQLLYPKQGQ
ncbi:MAG: hypothetical protein CEO22_288 [Candidatus Berkelbacteria bacterium Gr01-1014_85]|uniref:Uncharacterized protein n=1 Tax=Candidatus Berkelbacteria bacterium Gr01-1014_85 TaxID=2017150 RepID=A0A554JC64_9BACT|nr:MAG: hypothetical protein CEO22_288 [Candidatus Berkelbacteria bacterium Gr01-1014_85]